MELLVLYLVVVNVVTFIVYGYDKLQARRKQWRVPEGELLLLAAIGGSVGAMAGMKLWHHKTHHKKFVYGVPAILAIHVIMAVVLAVVVTSRFKLS